MRELRVTVAVAVVLRAFLAAPAESHYGYDLMRMTGFASGKLYPILARLQAAGWLETELEQVDPAAVKRPRRRWYRLSGEGAACAQQELAVLHQQLAPPPTGRRTARPQVGQA